MSETNEQRIYDRCIIRVGQLEEENDKLRELVLDWRNLAVGGANSLTDWNHEQADLERRMMELGVEI